VSIAIADSERIFMCLRILIIYCLFDIKFHRLLHISTPRVIEGIELNDIKYKSLYIVIKLILHTLT
jgi:hypothetical protein